MACLHRLCRISPAEQRVLLLLLEGASNRDIAAQLQLSPRTVESHMASMLEKTGCRNRSQLLLWGLHHSPTRGTMNPLGWVHGAVGVPGDTAQH